MRAVRNQRFASFSIGAALAVAASVGHAAQPCGSDVEACARLLTLENAGFMEACAAAFPAARPVFERALKAWPGMKLTVPGMAESLREGGPARTSAIFDANETLRKMSPEEKNNECSARLATLTKPELTLAGRAGSLPADAVKNYLPPPSPKP